MSYQQRVYREDGSFWVQEFRDDVTRTLTTYREDGTVSGTRAYTPAENATADAMTSSHQAIANLEVIRNNLVGQAIAWMEGDADAAVARAASVSSNVTAAQAKRAQVQSFTFNGSNVTNINNQLNANLKPILINILDYVIGLGQLAEGTESWRGTRADPSLIWLARHATDTPDA